MTFRSLLLKKRNSSSMKQLSRLLVALLLYAPAVQAQLEKKLVNPEDVANLKEVLDPQISPDGSLVAYVVSTPVASGKHKNSHIWLTPTAAAGQQHPFAFSGDAETTPRWSPDGASLAFLSDRKNPLAEETDGPFHFSLVPADQTKDLTVPEDKKEEDKKQDESGMQLWLIALRGGEAVPLTNISGGLKTFKWSRDGKFLAFIRTDQDTKEERDRKKQKNDQIVVNHDYHYDRLWIYDIAQHQARLVTKSDVNIDEFDWSPDGTQIVARVSPSPRLDDYWRVSKILILDGATGAVLKTLEEHAGYMPARWSPDGSRVAFSKMTPRHITDLHVVMELDNRKSIVVEDTFAGTLEDMLWSPDSKSLFIQGTVGAHTVIAKVDPASGAATPIEGIDVTANALNVSDKSGSLAFLGETPDHPAEVWVNANGKSLALTETNPQVKAWKLGTQREIQWKNSKDGKAIHGVLVLPPNYEKGTRYQTIVHIHGGPEEVWTLGFNANWYNYAAMLASHGYVVLLANPRGSLGVSSAFTEADFQDWGNGDFQDVMSGVDSLIAQGISDPERLAIGGWSFGGYMTAWTVTHTNRFKAAMVGAGVTDLFSMATTTDISPSYASGYFGDLATNSKLYTAHSPVRYLEQCHTPVLVLHGEADPRVPISQGEEFYNGLRFLGRDTLMVRYPREPHIFTEREHQIDSLQRILAWYDTHTSASEHPSPQVP
jgi:dipeptidyl aminopeptidase/acylaminoacyl peptidase